MVSRVVNVTFNGAIVGHAEVDEDSKVVEFEIEESDLKRILPGYDPTAGLSIAEPTEMLDPVSYAQYDVSLTELYYKNQPKGTFDA